jgi:hypothetical protein
MPLLRHSQNKHPPWEKNILRTPYVKQNYCFNFSFFLSHEQKWKNKGGAMFQKVFGLGIAFLKLSVLYEHVKYLQPWKMNTREIYDCTALECWNMRGIYSDILKGVSRVGSINISVLGVNFNFLYRNVLFNMYFLILVYTLYTYGAFRL